MYAQSAHIYDFKCFGKAVLNLRYPGKTDGEPSAIDNINLILGDNGGGKSSVLRAIAIAMLAPALTDSGFVAYRLVRRPKASASLLKVIAKLDPNEVRREKSAEEEIELLARIDRIPERNGVDRLHLERTPESPIERLIYSDKSPAFFVAGYGATRRVETGDYSPSAGRKSRGARYQRIASLFEDHVALRPLESVLNQLAIRKRDREAVALINRVLPNDVKLTTRKDKESSQPIISFMGADAPFSSLSDGYRAFVGMVGDLVGLLSDVATVHMKLDEIPGIVLIDEVDLHLHPSWQRRVVSDLAAAFPKLQFVMTSHSPLVVTTVERQNIFVTDTDEEGLATIKQLTERAYGRSPDQLLLSSYFGLDTIRPESSVRQTEAILSKIAKGDDGAAVEFLEKLSRPQSYSSREEPATRAPPAKRTAKKKK